MQQIDVSTGRVVARYVSLASEPAPSSFWGSAGAGCVLYAKASKRICLQKRSGSVEQPNTWGVFGGALDGDESPLEAVKRELAEETGYRGSVTFEKLSVFAKGTFRYHNFLAVIPAEFAPRHSWESSDHAWVTLDELPSPLHFGVKSLLPSLRAKVGELQNQVTARHVVARFLERQAMTALPVNFALYFKSLVRKTGLDIARMKKNVSVIRRTKSEYDNDYDDVLRNLRFSLSDVGERLIPMFLEPFQQHLERTRLDQGFRAIKHHLGLERFEEEQSFLAKFAEQSLGDVDTIMKENDVPAHLVQAYMECITIGQSLVARIRSLRAKLDSYRPGNDDEGTAVAPDHEKLEKLYHASIKARALYEHGFSAQTPGRGTGLGLGGSVEDKAGNGAVSFTSDSRFAHEIARWFKEMALVAAGGIKALSILKWAEKEGTIDKTVEWFNGSTGKVGDRMRAEGETYLVAESGRFRVKNLKWVAARKELVEEVGDLDLLMHSKKAIYNLYTAYINNTSHRDNPMFMEVEALLKRLEQENISPRDIGVIVAEIDMMDPDIRYVRGEQEYRVPPRSIKKVLRFM